MAKSKGKPAKDEKRRDVELAEVQRAIALLEEEPPKVRQALAALKGAAVGLEGGDGEGEGEE